MKRYRIDLQYVGTRYIGWQTQLNDLAIQDQVEKSLTTILRENTRALSASRTDAGVHALQQVVTFSAKDDLDCARIQKNLNGVLPQDIRVLKVAAVATEFHPITDSVGKCYIYNILHKGYESPFFANYSLSTPYTLDLERMREAAKVFIGEHDFTTFCASDSSAKTKVRTIHEIVVEDRDPLIRIWFTGNGFLKQMIRGLSGTMIEAGKGRLTTEQARELLENRERNQSTKTALAQGLCLYRIFYDRVQTVAEMRKESEIKFGFF